MPRSHALQPRDGTARSLAVRFTDEQRAALDALVEQRGTQASTLVREAVAHHTLTHGRGALSPFWTTFAGVLEQLVVAGIRPVLVGEWAAIAHGYVAGAPRMQILIRDEDKELATTFLEARGAKKVRLPAAFGHEPWAVEFVMQWDGLGASELRTTRFVCGRVAIDVVTLDELLRHITTLPARCHDQLWALKDGAYTNDDGARGEQAWDYAGRMNASAAYMLRDDSRLNLFVDYRHSTKAT